MSEYKKRYQEWISNDYFDKKTREELAAIAEDENEIKERFYKDLEFGTAGLRGIIGAGPNRMNLYTVGKATQGLADYILAMGKEKKGVVIAFDSRRMSREFAEHCACCLGANKIKAYIFEDLRPTPELSFAVRLLGCAAGINITASHNPPEYNGYKVYWEDGAQITAPHDRGIIDKVNAVSDYRQVKVISREEAERNHLYVVIGKDVDDRYMDAVLSQVKRREEIEALGNELCIVYSPLHGTGNLPVRAALKELGFTNVHVVKAQELPDGDFPTVSYPNPETKEAFALGLALGEKVGADLVLATDPDADRLGVYVKDSDTGDYRELNGNMSGCLLAEYELSQIKEKGGLPTDGFIVKSIVSSNLAGAIAKAYQVELKEVLTGFKFIGKEILRSEMEKSGTFLFGFEESYGCLIGDYARDKDAVVASVALCEAAAYYKTRGKTLWEAMKDIYEKYGYYREEVVSVTLSGIEGLEKIRSIMATFREDPPKTMGGYAVTRIRDYQERKITDVSRGCQEDISLPPANVLYYELEEGGWVCVRPSGTEPKIKMYYGICGKNEEDARGRQERLSRYLEDTVQAMK